MLSNDTYRTIEKISSGLYKEKSSKFISIAIPVTSETEVNEQLKVLKKDYHDANHCCYAYRLGFNKLVFRYNDDGEPSGTAGKPIYGQILSNDLTNILVVVIRYFGGTKLGVSGLIAAYKSAAKIVLENSIFITNTVDEIFTIEFDYENLNDVMKIIKENNLKQLSGSFENICFIKFSVRSSNSQHIISKFEKIKKLTLNHIQTI
jgi:uncharacterized YigZ family protein